MVAPLGEAERRLDEFLVRVLICAVTFAAVELAIAQAMWLVVPLEVASILVGFALVAAWARANLARRGGEATASVVGYAVLGSVGLISLVRPQGVPALLLACVLVVLMVLPYLEGAALQRMFRAAFGTSIAVAVVAYTRPPSLQLPLILKLTEGLGGIAGASYLCMLLIWSFSSRLRRTIEDGQQAIQVRDDFLSVAGHEMRTPLAALQLQTQALLRTVQRGAPPTGADLEHRLTKMIGSTQRLARLVDDLLDVSRVSAGKLVLEPEEMDLVALCQEVVARHSEQAHRMGSAVSFRGPERLVGAWDRMRLDQVLSNLLSNSIKYGAGRSVEVEVEATGETMALRVRDYGIGIDPGSHRRIFERFERAVNDSHYGGLGLGLWIVRQVVEACGGTVEVQSEEGMGATFTVRLPKQWTAKGYEPGVPQTRSTSSSSVSMLTGLER